MLFRSTPQYPFCFPVTIRSIEQIRYNDDLGSVFVFNGSIQKGYCGVCRVTKALKIIDVGEYESGEVKLLFTFKQGGEEVVIREEDK